MRAGTALLLAAALLACSNDKSARPEPTASDPASRQCGGAARQGERLVAEYPTDVGTIRAFRAGARAVAPDAFAGAAAGDAAHWCWADEASLRVVYAVGPDDERVDLARLSQNVEPRPGGPVVP